MAHSVRTAKALLTKIGQKARLIMTEITWDEFEPHRLTTEELVKDALVTITGHIRSLEETKTTFTARLTEFNHTLDTENLGTLTQSQEDQITTYLETATDILTDVDGSLVHLKRLHSSTTQLSISSTAISTVTVPGHAEGIHHSVPSHLPKLKVPKFNGDILEWDNYWSIFSSQVDSQPIDNVLKFTILLDSLTGEAKKLVTRYQVTSDNYELIRHRLQQKFGDTDNIISLLNDKLENCTSHGDRLEQQRELLEDILSISAQLHVKKVNLNSNWVLDRIRGKFSEKIQSLVLKRKRQVLKEHEPWDITALLDNLDEVIEEEETIEKSIVKHKVKETQNHFKLRDTEKKEVKENPRGRQQSKTYFCVYCNNNDHSSHRCTRLTSVEARKNFIKEHNLCFACLKKHSVKDCTDSRRCRCGGKHHGSICTNTDGITNTTYKPQHRDQKDLVTVEKSSGKQAQKTSNNSNVKPVQQYSLSHTDSQLHALESTRDSQFHALESHQQKPGRKGILLTGSAHVLNRATGNLRRITVLLDTGAERSFISTELATSLQLKTGQQDIITLHSFGTSGGTQRPTTEVTLQMFDAAGTAHELTLLSSDTVTDPLTVGRLDAKDMEEVWTRNITLSHSASTDDITPDILLGCDHLWEFITFGKEKIALPSGLLLIPSTLGYLVSGRDPRRHNLLSAIQNIVTAEVDPDQATWERHFTMDNAGVEAFSGTQQEERRQLDQQVWDQFQNTITRQEDGYYVRFPWKEDAHLVPDNKSLAEGRLRSVLKKLRETPGLIQKYDDIIQDQIKKGIVEKVDPTEKPKGVLHYLAHQAVITPQKETTKLRIVYDGSSHYKQKPSLNDVIHQGPVILPSIHGLLLRFRLGKVALVSDVEKAFLQVRLHEEDRDATRFLWIRDLDGPPDSSNTDTYRFTRVIFGINASPFLLGATIAHHLDQVCPSQELAMEMKDSLYVDNLLLTTETADRAQELYHFSKTTFDDMAMNLREFLCNDPAVTSQFHDKDKAEHDSMKILGVPWDSLTDTLHVKCHFPPRDMCSKRSISQQVASIYDPLGWMVPLLLPARRFQQRLWEHNYKWDTELSLTHRQEWNSIVNSIADFQKVLPRNILDSYGAQKQNLYVFTDASKEAIGACVYLQSGTHTHLLMAKGKLAPIKTPSTIPKLEMNGLTLGTRLVHTVYTETLHKLCIGNIYIFSDSNIALSWTRKVHEDQKPGVLVQNRVKEIRHILENIPIPVHFGYVNTKDNPADWTTRGLNREDFAEHMWWTGPTFIRQTPDQWPDTTELFNLTDEQPIDSLSTNILTVTATETSSSSRLVDLTRFSSLTKATRCAAYVLRFLRILANNVNPTLATRIHNVTSHFPSRLSLTGEEMQLARTVLIRDHQKQYLTDHVRAKMKDFTPHIDSNGIWRCKGRLNNTRLDNDSKQPILIERKSQLATLIVHDCHTEHGIHHSVGETMTAVRQTYWIPQLRQLCKTMVRKCVPCQRMNNQPYKYPEMEDLPACRVTRSRPFANIGLDFFGPLDCLDDHDEKVKSYGMILTCMVTRLTHLELVDSLTTESFIMGLRQFISRRGCPSSITCDNAPSFLLGEQILGDTFRQAASDDTVRDFVANKEIVWKHITPYAPWQGSHYERMIKSVKHGLYKTLGKKCVSKNVLRTLLHEVEATLNSRPLTYIEEKWEERPILRPIDFIQRDMLISIPTIQQDDAGLQDAYLPADEFARLQTRRPAEEALISSERLTELYWEIWHNDYITQLRETHKLRMDNKAGTLTPPTIGEVVLITDSNQPRNVWKLGRIVGMKHSSTGTVREVELLLPNRRTIKRPVNQVVPLEIPDTALASTDQQHTSPAATSAVDEPRYNLRSRRHVNYTDAPEDTDISVNHLSCQWHPSLSTLLYFFTLMLLMVSTTAQSLGITCTKGGVNLSSSKPVTYHLCADDYCFYGSLDNTTDFVKLPPKILLHDHTIEMKIDTGKEVVLLSNHCPADGFCEHVDCTLCTATLMNPECSPLAAIAAVAFFLYFIITGFYVFLYVPLVIGLPVRYGFSSLRKILRCVGTGLCHCITWTARRLWRRCTQRRHRTYADIALGLIMLTLIHGVQACQMIDVATTKEMVCQRKEDGRETCKIETTEIFKINALRRDACLQFWNNGSLVMDLRIHFHELRLICDKDTLGFTRNVEQHILDSKRCAHMGSCSQGKCKDVHEDSLLPELLPANTYPGITRCVESCGGLGCDCFYPSSACLFYRIYMKPRNPTIYEIVRCIRWEEEVVVHITSTRAGQPKKTAVLRFAPNIPQPVHGVDITLSIVALPVLPILNTHFIHSTEGTSLWDPLRPLLLECDSVEHATSLNCTAKDTCNCQPAESTMNCQCDNFNLQDHMTSLANSLPIRTPAVTLSQDKELIIATVPNKAMAELVIHIDEDLEMPVVEIDNAHCSIPNSVAQGCYSCLKGAVTELRCTSSINTTAEIDCQGERYSVTCTPGGFANKLTLVHSQARLQKSCMVSCGMTPSPFQILGVLKFTGEFSDTMWKWVQGESVSFSEITWPDVHHLWDMYVSWYKHLAIALLVVGLAVLITVTHGTAVGRILWKLFRKSVVFILLLFFRVAGAVWYGLHAFGRCLFHRSH